jgi:predicted RNA polymerase sigma factor
MTRCKRINPYWAARAHFLKKLGREREARAAFETAQHLTEDPAVRGFLQTMSEDRGC